MLYIFSGGNLKALFQPSGRLFPELLTITSPDYLIGYGLKVGSSVSDLEFLGESVDDSAYKYCGEANCISFQVKDSIVTEIQVYFYWS